MHLHVHVVPRFVRDSGFMEAACETKVLPQTVSQVAEKLKKNINILR
jgi:diadenosine tetraphosphate (Ap4A) HIT family hydrolase